MTLLLLACVLLTVGLATWSLAHYVSAAVFVFGRRGAPVLPTSPPPTDAVTVLVPARNEGAQAVRALTSLVNQDHAGPLAISLLVRDAEDSSIPFLMAAFPGIQPGIEHAVDGPPSAGTRRITLVLTGSDPKSSKLNAVVPTLTTPYVAILDCDHAADPEWVRTSLAVLEATGGRIVQGRRRPIPRPGFFHLWDSLHQHVGCEVYNSVFSRLGLTVFFTGTTALMETRLLRDHAFGACITEDTDFSYALLGAGVRIHHNPHSGSREETSPDLASFLARRRRWANGHTDAFFRHIGAPYSLPPRARLQLLLHGTHYLVAAVVWALHVVIACVFVGTLSLPSLIAAAGTSAIAAAAMTRGQQTPGRAARAAETGALFAAWLPTVLVAMNLGQAVLARDLARAALPIPHAIEALGVLGLAAPLAVLAAGFVGGLIRGGPRTVLAIVLSYPVAFYIDLCGILLGLADRLTGSARWRAIARATPTPDAGRLVALRRGISARMKPSRWIPAAVAAGLFGLGVIYAPSPRIPVVAAPCRALEHDGEPWIVPAQKLAGYCATPKPDDAPDWTRRTGTFTPERTDTLESVDPTFWDRLDSTFFCNEAVFSPDNVVAAAEGGVRLELKPSTVPGGVRAYTSGSIATKTADYTYGRFETVLRPAKASGVLTAFFLYRFDPWQEIDAEFLGRDTTKLLVNVYYNPGEEGDLYNYGLRGTPALIDLGFDASLDYHRYAIEWEPTEIRWFVDDRLVHRRPAGRPTPIPHLPMRFHVNAWPCCSEELAGPFAGTPVSAGLRSVTLSRWVPSRLPPLFAWLDPPGDDWRDRAEWIQR